MNPTILAIIQFIFNLLKILFTTTGTKPMADTNTVLAPDQSTPAEARIATSYYGSDTNAINPLIIAIIMQIIQALLGSCPSPTPASILSTIKNHPFMTKVLIRLHVNKQYATLSKDVPWLTGLDKVKAGAAIFDAAQHATESEIADFLANS